MQLVFNNENDNENEKGGDEDILIQGDTYEPEGDGQEEDTFAEGESKGKNKRPLPGIDLNNKVITYVITGVCVVFVIIVAAFIIVAVKNKQKEEQEIVEDIDKQEK